MYLPEPGISYLYKLNIHCIALHCSSASCHVPVSECDEYKAIHNTCYIILRVG